MGDITGLSSSKLADYNKRAAKLIAKYDKNNSGTLEQSELTRFDGHTWSSFDNRLNDDFVMRTTIYYDRYTSIKDDQFRLADANHDGHLSGKEMVNGYLQERDTNHDGNLSTWERFKMSLTGIEGKFETSREVETDRSSQMVYDPLPQPYYPSDRPVPPSTGQRPTPPSTGSRPTPPPVR